MNTLLFYSIFIFSQINSTNVISIDSALIFFNGKAVPKCSNCGYIVDSNYNPTVTDSVLFEASINKSVLNYDKFMFLLTVLKLMDDSLKTNIVTGINTKNLKFVIGKKQISCDKLINNIKKSNFKSCYVSMCIKFLKSQIEWGLIQGQIDKNMISGTKEDYINSLSQFLCILNLSAFVEADTISVDSKSCENELMK